ncbi:MAG: hypothetical protein U0930_03895 [Pirellulales bacterium]
MSLNDFAGFVAGAAILALAFVAWYSHYTNRASPQHGTMSDETPELASTPDVVQPMQFADHVFGQCQFNGIDAYDCRVEIPTPHSTTTIFATHVWALESTPSERQRSTFANFVSHYDELWPKIADTLATLHPTLNSPDE